MIDTTLRSCAPTTSSLGDWLRRHRADRGSFAERIMALLLMVCMSATALQGQPGAAAVERVPVLLSTDIGNEVDDQWAVTYLLTEQSFDVRGILSAHAPSLPDPAAHSSFLVLRDAVENRLGLREHPPLIEGGSVPMPDATHPQPSDAVRFLIATSQGFTPQHRLTVLTIGAATDVASALLTDPSLADRIRVVAMAFKSLQPTGPAEFNVQNDPHAWQAILQSKVPLVVGTGDVCRATLSLNYAQAEALLKDHGPIGAWLWDDYRKWYFRQVKPPRVADFSKNWVIWDVITLAYVRGLTTGVTVPRPSLTDGMRFEPSTTGGTMENISALDTPRLWREFLTDVDRFQETHAVPPFVP